MRPRSRVAALTLSAALLLMVALGLAGCTSGDKATTSSASVASSSSPNSTTSTLASPATTGEVSTTATAPAALTGEKVELYAEIQRLREGMKSGTLVLDWYPPGITMGDLPSDPILFLDSLEQSLFNPDVTVYLMDAAGEAADLRSEIAAMPEVARLVFVSKHDALERLKEDFKDEPEILANLEGNPLPAVLEIWLKDYSKAASFADRLRGRPEVDEARTPGMDYGEWATRLRSLAHPPAPSGVTSTTG